MTASSDAEIADTEPTAAGRSSFDPPAPRGLGLALALALLAHLLLVLALAWGLRWKKDAQEQAVDAELWSAIAQLAAPKAAQPPPPVAPPDPPPVPKPDPTPAPPPPPAPPVQDDSARQAEIALEQQKQREEQQRKAAERKRKIQEEQRRAEEEKKRQQAQLEEEKRQRQIAEAKAQAEAEKKAAEQRERQEKQRRDAIRRMTALASADQAGMSNTLNGPGQTPGGTAKRDAGPSASYGAKVRAKVKPNINYSDLINIKGNPVTEVEVRTSPDGTIIYSQVVKPSGVQLWDDAVIRALKRTQTLPRDVDGRVPSPVIIKFTPHE